MRQRFGNMQIISHLTVNICHISYRLIANVYIECGHSFDWFWPERVTDHVFFFFFVISIDETRAEFHCSTFH